MIPRNAIGIHDQEFASGGRASARRKQDGMMRSELRTVHRRGKIGIESPRADRSSRDGRIDPGDLEPKVHHIAKPIEIGDRVVVPAGRVRNSAIDERIGARCPGQRVLTAESRDRIVARRTDERVAQAIARERQSGWRTRGRECVSTIQPGRLNASSRLNPMSLIRISSTIILMCGVAIWSLSYCEKSYIFR